MATISVAVSVKEPDTESCGFVGVPVEVRVGVPVGVGDLQGWIIGMGIHVGAVGVGVGDLQGKIIGIGMQKEDDWSAAESVCCGALEAYTGKRNRKLPSIKMATSSAASFL